MQLLLSKNSKIVPWLGAGAACTLITLGLFKPVFSLAALLVCLFVVVFCHEQDTICVLFMVMSFANIFKAGPGEQSFFTYVLLFYVLWHFIRKLKVSQTIALILIYALYLFAIQFAFDSFHLFRSIKYIVNFLFLHYAFENYDQNRSKEIFLFYVLGVIVTSLIKASDLFPKIVLYIAEKDFGYSTGRALRFAGLYGDPNYYSINVIISMCLIVIMFHKKELGTLTTLLFMGIFVWFASMTGSKSALFMLVWPTLLLVYSNSKNRRHFLQAIFIMAAVVFVLLVIEGKIGLFNNTLERIDRVEDVDSLTTGRSELWGEYFDFFSSELIQLLLGAGLGASLVQGHAAHNTYIDILYYLGLIGGALLMVILVQLTNMLPKPRSRNLLNYSVVGTILIMYVFLSQLFYFDLAFQIMLAIIVLRLDITKRRGRNAGSEEVFRSNYL